MVGSQAVKAPAGTADSFSNCATYSKQTSYTPEYGVIGYETKIGTLVTYVSHLFLVGYDMEKFRKDETLAELWRLRVTSTGETGDLRRIFPVLLAGAKNYIGRSTGQKIKLEIYEASDEVLKIKGLME